MPHERAGITDAPQAILAARDRHPTGWMLHSVARNKALELEAAAALPEHTLMRRAGLAVARWAMAWAPHSRHVSLLIGPGNNGGDAFEAALHLQSAGYSVHGRLILPDGLDLHTHAWPRDAALSLQRALHAGIRLSHGTPGAEGAAPDHLIIDGLLGRGLGRTVEGPLRSAIDWAMAAKAGGSPVLAIDVPSGLPADTGHVRSGDACVQADATLALLSLPVGLFTAQGRDHSGDVWFHDLGVDTAALAGAQACLASRPMLARGASWRSHADHKGSFGDVLVIGGAPGMAGAARLAARAALYGGAGRVYAAYLSGPPVADPTGSDASTPSSDAADLSVDPDCPEVMHASVHEILKDPCPWSHAVVVAGCGGGSLIGGVLPDLLDQAPRLVLDADALNAIAAHEGLQSALRARSARGHITVLTPHPLEAARLLGCTVAQVQADRLQASQLLADRTGAVVLLKGSGTLIALPQAPCPGTVPWLLAVGNAGLATAGSGDVLAGLIGAQWGQSSRLSGDLARSEPADATTPAHIAARAFEQARAAAGIAVYLHGTTAETLSPQGCAVPASLLAKALQGRSIHTGPKPHT